MNARVWVGVSVLALLSCGTAEEPPPEPLVRDVLALPEHLETPFVPEFNPLTAEKIELGRHLFYDRRLSANGTKSCADCHDPSLAFADGERLPVGSTGTTLRRNSQGLANVAYMSSLTWASDGLLLLEDQIHVPLRSDNPVELGVTDGVAAEVLARFDADPLYEDLFEAAFGPRPEGRTLNEIVFALASFCRSLISGNSAYDRFVAGDDRALDEQQIRGMQLFFGERLECFHCHTGVNLTVSYRDENTDPESVRLSFFNNGLYDVDGLGSYPAHDQGLYDLTLNPNHRGLFRPQSLRNVELTAPYMHDGSLETLEDVLRHYAAGGRLTEDGPLAGDGRLSPLKSGLVRGFAITDEEVQDVLAFLRSMTDGSFVEDPRYRNPFEP